MRIAVAGKGGVGKTTVVATLARLHGRRGGRVVAVDADSNPNLGAALGLAEAPLAQLSGLPAEIVSRRVDGGPALARPLHDVLRDHAVTAPDGVRLVMMGQPAHADEGCLCSAHAAAAALLADLAGGGVLTLMDLEASPEHFSRGTARHADALVLVTEPYWRSLETTGRMAELARELGVPAVHVLANKLRSGDDLDAVVAYCAGHGLDVLARLPWSDAVIDADVTRTPLVDAAGTGDVVATLDAVLTRLTAGSTAFAASL